MFNRRLSKPIQPSERAALWATEALLGTIAFYHIEAKTPEEAWPLKPPSSSDLDWLRMTDGKKEIWRLTQPMRADSIFQALTPVQVNDLLPTSLTEPKLEALPSNFIKLYSLDATSTTNNNPYHAAAYTLARSLNIDSIVSIILNFLSFISQMCPGYNRLQATTRAKGSSCASAASMLVRKGLPMPELVASAAAGARMSSHLHILGEVSST